jgi:hypothetical protein
MTVRHDWDLTMKTENWLIGKVPLPKKGKEKDKVPLFLQATLGPY